MGQLRAVTMRFLACTKTLNSKQWPFETLVWVFGPMFYLHNFWGPSVSTIRVDDVYERGEEGCQTSSSSCYSEGLGSAELRDLALGDWGFEGFEFEDWGFRDWGLGGWGFAGFVGFGV